MQASELIDLFIKLLIGAVPLSTVFIALLFFPEQIEKWSSILWKLLTHVLRFAHKKYVKHDLQGRVNGFVKKVRKEIPDLGAEPLKIEWIDTKLDRKSFIDNGNVIIRLKRDDPEDHNFVHGAYHYISISLLKKAKMYLSKSQKTALDLFVCSKIVKAEKPNAVDFFVSEYLHQSTEKTAKVKELVDDFAIIDEGKLFFTVLLQELHFIGEKVFGRLKNDQIINEVNALVGFLKPIVERSVGDQSQLDYHGPYCNFAIVIVGKSSKISESIEPYVKYIKNRLLPDHVETIYLICKREHCEESREIANRFSDTYYVKREVNSVKKLKFNGGEVQNTQQFLLVMRKRDIDLVQPSSATV